MSEKVFVPEYHGKKVYEGYISIPSEEFLPRTACAVEKFIDERNCKFTIRTLEGTTKNISRPSVNFSNDRIYLLSTGGFCYASIKPTKYGTDTVSSNQERIWLFDDETLDELDLICQNN